MTLVTLNNGAAVTTSLAIAEGTQNQHKNVLEMVRSYLADLKEFGRVAFETRPFETAGGKQQREVALLNEQQSTLLLTYMRNSDIVRQFKKALVKAFWEMRQQGLTVVPPSMSVAASSLPRNVTVFNGVPVLTMARLAGCFGVSRDTLRGNQVMKPASFKLGVHYFKLSGQALRNFQLDNLETGEVTRRGRELLIWSQEGVEAHARMFPAEIAERGREALSRYLGGEVERVRAPLTVPALLSSPGRELGQGFSATLRFESAAGFGMAMPELLALVQRHGIQFSVTGGPA